MRRVSVIINTDGRAQSLPDTVAALRRLDYQDFEICVVCGPTDDGTLEIAQHYAQLGWIKVAHCPKRNLSQSRNIGIAMAAGEIVAFIDDDAIPEPEWLTQLVAAYSEPSVKAAGGKVFDHTGYTYQYVYATCDRLGNAAFNMTEASDQLNFPFSYQFPYIQGANSSFERNALISIGGFDEEFEFYLDETDVCCRLIDQGHVVRQINGASVHHKYLPSSIRNSDKITTKKFPILKNKIYFSIINNHGHFRLQRAIEDGIHFAHAQRADLEFHIAHGRLPPEVLEDFDEDLESAWQIGLSRGLSGRRRTQPADFFRSPSAFLPCPTLKPAGHRKTFVFLSQSFPPAQMDGIARYTSDITRAIAANGHIVHVITRGTDYNRVDLEEGVWVHRLLDKKQIPEELADQEKIPQPIWDRSRTILEEVERIASIRTIDVIEASSWDCENIALILDGRIPVATNIVTTLSHWLDTHEELKADPAWMTDFGNPMQAVEHTVFERSDMILAASTAIVESIESRYGVPLSTDPRVHRCPHGMADMFPLPRKMPAGLVCDSTDNDRVRILFLGRLELRKGIDVLLQAAPNILRNNPKAEFWIAGDDTLVLDGGLTARQKFVRDLEGEDAISSRVQFLGKVSDDELRWLYANCDIYTSPSRFESFGLIFIEAMMFSKPSIGTQTSGITEILEHDVTGLLAEVGDAASLEREISKLVRDEKLRRVLGDRGRAEFERIFASPVVADRRIAALSKIMREDLSVGAVRVPENARPTDRGHLLSPGAPLKIDATGARSMHLTFYCHSWSGFVAIKLDDEVVEEVDLFHPNGCFRTVNLTTGGAKFVEVSRVGIKSAPSFDTEVIFNQVRVCRN